MIKEALDAYAATLDKVWAHDRSKTIGASEIGQCARRVWYEKSKRPQPATVLEQKVQARENYGAALRGTMMENYFWYPAMKRKFGKDLKFAGPRGQRTLTDGRLSSTSDGLVVNQPPGALRHLGVKDIESDCFAVECKTIDPRVNLTKEKDEHHFQAQVQMGLYRSQTRWWPLYNVVSYVDASFWSEVGEYVVKFDPEVLKVAQKRSEFIYAAQSPADLPPEGWIAGGKECEYCPFVDRCDAQRRAVPTAEGPLDDKQFEEQLVQACRVVQNHAKTRKSVVEEERAAQEAVKELLRKKGVRSWPKVVSWSVIGGRESYDMKGLKEAAVRIGLDLDPFCKVGEPSDRFEVKLREVTRE